MRPPIERETAQGCVQREPGSNRGKGDDKEWRQDGVEARLLLTGKLAPKTAE